METGKKLIPYSVHLSESVYLKLKEAAKGRKASSIVRDSITMILEGEESFNAGYKQALRDVEKTIRQYDPANAISFDGVIIANGLIDHTSGLKPGK